MQNRNIFNHTMLSFNLNETQNPSDLKFEYNWLNFTDVKIAHQQAKSIKQILHKIQNLDDETRAGLLFKLGTYYLFAKFEPAKALQFFEQSKHIHAKFYFDNLNHIALCHFKLGDLTKSRRCVNTVLNFCCDNNAADSFDENHSLITLSLYVLSLHYFAEQKMQVGISKLNYAMYLIDKVGIKNDIGHLIKFELAKAMVESSQESGAKCIFQEVAQYWRQRTIQSIDLHIFYAHHNGFEQHLACYIEEGHVLLPKREVVQTQHNTYAHTFFNKATKATQEIKDNDESRHLFSAKSVNFILNN